MRTASVSAIRKGDIVAVQAVNDEVWFHHQSPTGGSTDYAVMTMKCLSNEQAIVIGNWWGERLGLDPAFYPEV